MSTAVPDPRTFTGWSEAFAYPIPTTRQLERRLRADADASSTKLRDLVGTSYRDLLNTANAIVEIHGQTEQVEQLLRKVGTRLNVRGIERGGRNTASLRQGSDELAGRNTRLERGALGAVLRGAITYVERVVGGDIKGGDYLTAAKVLVVGRLVGRALTNQAAEDSGGQNVEAIEALGRRLGSVRNKLIKKIDRRLAKSKTTDNDGELGDTSGLVASLTAFALATSSPPTEVLRHFQSVRLNAIRGKAADPLAKTTSSVKRLNLYIATLRESRTIFVNLLAASLRSLAAGNIFEDAGVKRVEQLNLEVNGRWIDAEIRNYAPRTRHDELSKADAVDLQRQWASEALSAVAESINRDIQALDDIDAVVRTRKEVLQAWLSSRQHARSLDPKSALDRLRQPFQQRITSLLSSRFTDLQSAVRKRLMPLISSPDSIEAAPALWTGDLTTQDIGRGATAFRSSVIAARRGHTSAITDLLKDFDAAADSIAEAQVLVKQMRDTRWDDDYDDDYSEEDEEDVAESNSHEILSKTEPEAIQNALAEASKTTYAALDEFFASQVAGEATSSCKEPNSPGIVLLRVLNELRHRGADDATFSSPQTSLQQSLASSAVQRVAPTIATAFRRTYLNSSTSFSLVALWDSSDESLPLQPSSAPVRVLRDACHDMASFGPDLWGRGSTSRRLFKQELQQEVRVAVEATVEEIEQIHSANVATAAAAPAGSDASEAEAPAEPKNHAEAEPETEEDGNKVEEGKEEGGQVAETTEKEASPPPGGAVMSAEDAHALRRHKLLQLAFDALYLGRALAVDDEDDASSDAASAAELPSKLAGALPELSQSNSGRLRAAAAEHWRRTYLLWGLLA